MRNKNVWKLYEWIDKYPYRSFHDLIKDMNWSHKKTRKYLDRLIDYGIVKHKNIILYDDGVDLRSGFYATPWQDLVKNLKGEKKYDL